MEVKDLFKALRDALGLSQEDIARAMKGEWPRDRISKIETGKNKLSSFRARTQLAEAFQIDVEWLAGYLDGKATLEQVLAHRAERSVPTSTRKPSPRLNDREDWEAAIEQAKELARDLPEEIWIRIGTYIDHQMLGEPTDPEVVADIAMAIHKGLRRRERQGPTSVSSVTPPATKRSRRK